MSEIDDQVLRYSPKEGTYRFANEMEVFCGVLWSKNIFNSTIINNPEFEEED